MRQALALAALFGFGCFAFLWLGIPGAARYGLGIIGVIVSLGAASGYWIGDPVADNMVTELMRWLKENRKNLEGQGSAQSRR